MVALLISVVQVENVMVVSHTTVCDFEALVMHDLQWCAHIVMPQIDRAVERLEVAMLTNY